MPSAMRGKSPAAVCRRYRRRCPVAASVVLPHFTISATMLAFHEPPDAVTAPVTKAGKIAGRISRRHHSQPRHAEIAGDILSSVGSATVPPMTLNRMYHCVPRIISGLSQISGLR